jgi:hypothetical protein
MENEEKSGYEVMQEFLDENKMHHFEGDRGVKQLNEICKALGYKEQCYMNGTSLEEFLRDNSGACQAIVDWITEWIDRCPEWKEALSFEEDEEEENE